MWLDLLLTTDIHQRWHRIAAHNWWHSEIIGLDPGKNCRNTKLYAFADYFHGRFFCRGFQYWIHTIEVTLHVFFGGHNWPTRRTHVMRGINSIAVSVTQSIHWKIWKYYSNDRFDWSEFTRRETRPSKSEDNISVSNFGDCILANLSPCKGNPSVDELVYFLDDTCFSLSFRRRRGRFGDDIP